MRRLRQRAWRGPAMAVALLCPSAAAIAGAASMSWSQAFPVSAPPADVHYLAHYLDSAGQRHQLEVWRAGEGFVHRVTDGRLQLYAAAQADGEYAYRYIDSARRRVVDVSRTNLYRIGVFDDPWTLLHVVEKPRAAYRLESVAEAESLPGCRWRLLTRTAPAAAYRVCWSTRWSLPLRIQQQAADAQWRDQYVVDEIRPWADAGVPGLPPIPAGYQLRDANEAIDPHVGD